MVEFLIIVEGEVQGVGYRAFAQREAAGLRLSGYARNLDDGRVEILAQGERDAVDLFIGRIWEGPFLAAVRDVSVIERRPGPLNSAFEVR